MSKIHAQVMAELNVKHWTSGAYQQVVKAQGDVLVALSKIWPQNTQRETTKSHNWRKHPGFKTWNV